MRRVLIAAAVAAWAGSAGAQTTETRQMAFADCLKLVRTFAGQIGVAPVNIVETDVLRIVRFPTADGSVLVTCSTEAGGTLAVTKSPHKCGETVNC